jgi:hypothetical protein
MDCEYPLIPLMLLLSGRAVGGIRVGVNVGVGVSVGVGDAVGVGVNGEGGNGVLVELTRIVSVCVADAGRSAIKVPGSGRWLK